MTHVVNMFGTSTALQEIILMIDSEAKFPFGNCPSCAHDINIKVHFTLNEQNELKVVGFEQPKSGIVGVHWDCKNNRRIF